ncbi:MAG: AMP-binding protein [Burkholderiaceae bacterium]|nr:AMP-binding protein [Burkholderiaceae bacterium]
MQSFDHALSIFAAAADSPDAVALRTGEKDYRFSELALLAKARLVSLQTEQKLPAQGRPYILDGQNSLDTLVTLYALLAAKVPVLMLHPKITDHERHELLMQMRAITQPLPHDTAAVLFTSGTTGAPKPAIITHKMLIASARASAKNLGWEANDCWQLCMSIARVGGLSILTRCLMARKTLAISPLFDAKSFTEALIRDRVTITSIVPTMLAKVFEVFPDWVPPKHLRTILLGGSTAPESLLAKAHAQGVPIVATYGMTETCSHVVMTPYDERYNLHAGCGEVIDFAEVKTVDGEILVRSEMTSPGYWGSDEEPCNRWFKTGDLGEFDNEGFLRIHARRQDLILTGGENVYPLEVENALTRAPFIKEALLIGEPNDTWGAIVCALIVAQPGMDPTHEDVKHFAKANLSSYKCPRKVAFVDKLPVNSADKLNRHPSVLKNYTLTTLHYKH